MSLDYRVQTRRLLLSSRNDSPKKNHRHNPVVDEMTHHAIPLMANTCSPESEKGSPREIEFGDESHFCLASNRGPFRQRHQKSRNPRSSRWYRRRCSMGSVRSRPNDQIFAHFGLATRTGSGSLWTQQWSGRLLWCTSSYSLPFKLTNSQTLALSTFQILLKSPMKISNRPVPTKE
jgi:hypothetical protein